MKIGNLDLRTFSNSGLSPQIEELREPVPFCHYTETTSQILAESARVFDQEKLRQNRGSNHIG